MGCKQGTTGFYQFETADLVISLNKPNVLKDAQDVVVSIVQGSARLDYHIDDLELDTDTSQIGVHISQEDAGKFKNATAAVQVNVLYETGERDVSAQGSISIFTNLYKQVM